MSLRRFNGWEPTETHEHFDADGILTGTTVVTREPEWDDDQRNIALGMQDFERQTCPGCGGHYSHTLDNGVARDVTHEKFECLDCNAIHQVQAAHHKKHGDKESACDCESFATYVSRYVPIPTRG